MTTPTTEQTEFPYKNALVRVQLSLDLPEEEVRRIVEADVLVAPDDPDYHEAAMQAIEARVFDDLPRFLEWETSTPEIEADG